MSESAQNETDKKGIKEIKLLLKLIAIRIYNLLIFLIIENFFGRCDSEKFQSKYVKNNFATYDDATISLSSTYRH